MVKRFFALLVASLCTVGCVTAQSKLNLDLSGKWKFRVDSLDEGISKKWYSQNLEDEVTLPGSMTTNLKGDDITVNTPWTGSIEDSSWFRNKEYAKYRDPKNIKVPFWLQPVKYYKGAAWYQKAVLIPESWSGSQIKLYLERCHWTTGVWLDDQSLGTKNSLSTPNIFTLPSNLRSGKHKLTIRVDNRVSDINVGQNSHSISDHTQTNWNGVVGKILLEAYPQVIIEDVKLYPDIKTGTVTAKILVNNNSASEKTIGVSLKALNVDRPSDKLPVISKSVKIRGKQLVTVIYPMGKTPMLWDEFNPHLYRMAVSAGSGTTKDERLQQFGMREFGVKNTQFTINGKLTFLRGTLECAVFPKTGYPPTDLASWLRELKICKDYGLNHIRFHSWCPPEAAFDAADQLGMYFQIECGSWANQGATVGDGKPLDRYLYAESERIVSTYGNHPSFCLMAYGNEPAGKNHIAYLTSFVKYWQQKDKRRLYTTAAGWPIVKESDYNSTPAPRIQQWGEGLTSIINSKEPNTMYDWSAKLQGLKQPTVSHEIGQWCVYPDFDEIKKYNGVLKAKNFEIFQDLLNEHGMKNRSNDFLFASGKLQSLCYKADIEAALRTNGFGGFQLLGLNDFPGQGTALVGVLDAFWQDKGYISAKEFSQFCGPVVPLLRLPKMIYNSAETIKGHIEVAQFGPSELKNVATEWEITDDRGKMLFSGKLPAKDIVNGNISLGDFSQPLSSITKPSHLTIKVEIENYKNAWDIFVYPPEKAANDNGILIVDKLTVDVTTQLEAGKKVLLTLKKGSLKPEFGGDIAIGFSTIFWNTAWTKGQPPVTMGVLCNPEHAVFENFPTQKYSNWQWFDAMTHSSPILLNKLSDNIDPLVRVIDDWVTARPLGLLFECKVGKGSLMVSGIDLFTDMDKRPVAKQLKYSILNYMASGRFSPDKTISASAISQILN
ncbi:sugar-binding domain-containing protein [Hufsiella arboris]|nr:sugar-binding domain-containing protein [Hufsiella arboris]